MVPEYAYAKIHLHAVLAALPRSKGKGIVFYGQGTPSGEYTTADCGINYQLLAAMPLKLLNGPLIVAVDHSGQRKMAS